MEKIIGAYLIFIVITTIIGIFITFFMLRITDNIKIDCTWEEAKNSLCGFFILIMGITFFLGLILVLN